MDQSGDQKLPKLFKLYIDCFDEISDYLSLRDLISFDATSKAIQKLSGDNYLNKKLNSFRALT